MTTAAVQEQPAGITPTPGAVEITPAASETPAAAAPAVEDEADPFEAAFQRLSETPDEDDPKPAEPAKKEEPAAAAPDPVKEAEAEAEAAAAAVGNDNKPPAKEEPAAPAADAEGDDAILKKLAGLVKGAAPDTQQAAPKETTAPEPEKPFDPAEGIYTPEEIQAIEAYTKDWADVSKGEALIRRAEYRAITHHIYNEIIGALLPKLEVVDALADTMQHNALAARVENYDDMRDKVTEWAKTQPEYLQVAYNRVISEGTVDEVVDLIGRFQKETGMQVAAPAAKAAPAPAAKKEPELPAAAKQAAAALAPVGSSRSAVVSGTDPNDFESAFKEFADKDT